MGYVFTLLFREIIAILEIRNYTYTSKLTSLLAVFGDWAIVGGLWALKKWMLEHKITNGSRSNFSLQKWKMAENKYQREIQVQITLAQYWIQYNRPSNVLFWGNGCNKNIQSKIEKKFGAPLKLYNYSIFLLLPKFIF